MKRLIVLAALALALCAPAAFAQGDRTDMVNRPTNLYITSMYRVRVYLNNRVVDILRPGQRTKIMKTKGGWLFVQYYRGAKLYQGWIRR